MNLEAQTVSSHCVALTVHRLVAKVNDAAGLVRSALELSGLEIWPKMELELFPSADDTLIIARPACDVSVCIADYALPFLSGGEI